MERMEQMEQTEQTETQEKMGWMVLMVLTALMAWMEATVWMEPTAKTVHQGQMEVTELTDSMELTE